MKRKYACARVVTYLVTDGQSLKIGCSAMPEDRLLTLQTANSSELTLLGFVDGNYEKELHKKYSSLRINGEWFKCHDSILNEFPGALLLQRSSVFTAVSRPKFLSIFFP